MAARHLRIPSILAVAVLGSCSPTVVQPDDVADATIADATDVTDAGMDACPDPFACFLDFRYLADGQVQVIYRRADGGESMEPCPPVPPYCPVA